MLAHARRYDRAAGYFSSTSLAMAAVGLEPFLERGGHIRLVVNHHLADEDVAAVERGLALRDAVTNRLRRTSLTVDVEDAAVADRLRLLCSLVAMSQLDIKVAVPCQADGTPLKASESTTLHHAKFGVFTGMDGEQVTFEGSNNETGSGWASNYETYTVAASWDVPLWTAIGQGVVDDFARHWEGAPPQGWTVVELPEAAREGLIAKADLALVRQSLAQQGRDDEIDAVIARILSARGDTLPDAEPNQIAALLAAPTTTAGVGIGTAVVDPWPHQYDVARKVVGAWPSSEMFSDEVGLGKTIEVGLVLRELLVSGQVRRALLLVPAAVLGQWQSELWEKFTIAIPILDGAKLVWPEGAAPDGQAEQAVTGNRWDAAPVLLASSHLARRQQERQHLIARHWDLVVVDEAHHARRRGSKATKDDPNALLQLLRRMRDAKCWDGLLLATATPMQMHPHEAYDLLAILGLPGPDREAPEEPCWQDAGAQGFTRYYEQLTVEHPDKRDWKHLRGLARSHELVWPSHNPHLLTALDTAAHDGLLSRIAAKAIPSFAQSFNDRKYSKFDAEALSWLDAWLREHTPMRTLVHRNTRHLLRAYQESGIIDADVVIPVRHVRDERVKFDQTEQVLYDRIESWIRDKYAQVQTGPNADSQQARATGFIMTVYRRRLTSSFAAIELSLTKRRDMLKAHLGGALSLANLLDDDDRRALDDVPDEFQGLLDSDDTAQALTDTVLSTGTELEELNEFLDALASRPNFDSKLQRIIDDLHIEFGHAKPDGDERQAIVFTQFTDTMDALRAQLIAKWPGKVACYSGRGGEIHILGPMGGTWKKTPKAAVKEAFRRGDYKVLVGTDAMSEGLNLQTCDLLYNLDLPWNFMRVEQRIGRIDRIGGHPDVHIVNLLITDTVEERIYSGIKQDFGDFESIVGAAQPVLAQTEEAIRTAAFATGPNRDTLLAQQAQALIAAANDARTAPVSLDTFQATPNTWQPANPLPGEHDPDGYDWLQILRNTLTSHPVIGGRFSALSDDLWHYTDERGHTWTITFDRNIADASAGAVGLFVWGHPAFPTVRKFEGDQCG